MSHPVHLEVGNYIQQVHLPTGCRLLLSPECGGSQNLPLFCSHQKSNDTEYCNVDALLVRAGEVRLLLEIEESGLTPTKVCGKFLTSALSSYFIHDVLTNTALPLANEVTFVQIMDAESLPFYTKKIAQWRAMEQSIQSILPLRSIVTYRLFSFCGTQGFQTDQTAKEDFNRVLMASCGQTVPTAVPNQTVQPTPARFAVSGG